jgi:uncharacterized repeat protein (TIGR03843 family)
MDTVAKTGAMSEPVADRGVDLDTVDKLELLRVGDLDVEGRRVDASNATLFCTVTLDGVTAACVHKPIAGERPLWDFPDGTLSDREVAAYLVSDASGWDIVPPTVMRDGPFGKGMCQLWIDVDETVDLVALARSDNPQLRCIALLDAVINNADRKGGHLLPTSAGHIYGVDHGVCFAVEDKLRTLLWQWRGRPIPPDLLDTLTALGAGLDQRLGEQLCGLLAPAEVERTRTRIRRLLRRGRYPMPSADWPAVPWPPF